MVLLFNTPPSRTEGEDPGSRERPIRSLAKAVSWRVTGSVDTLILSWFFTGDIAIAAAIGSTEVVTKMLLYYVHERAWNRVRLGREGRAVANESTIAPLVDPVR
jgi:uncharacterized membrane protein